MGKKISTSEARRKKETICSQIDSEQIFRLREAIELLIENSIIHTNEVKDFENRIEQLIKDKNYFITNKFRTCETQCKTAYDFMMVLRSQLYRRQHGS